MKKLIKIGGQFSGIGAFDTALDKLGIKYENIYQAEWDKFARQSYLANHSKPKWYVEDVNDTPTDEIPSLDIAMFSPPCQAFSLAGSRKGEDDKRGVLFYNSHEFIQKNNPRYFIFENVKGLLSDDKGRTFQKWVDLLGGKSVNGNPVLFAHENSVPYHIYFKVLNAKHYGIPQNRERIFIVGIRDDSDNTFIWPKQKPLEKRLKHVLEIDVDEKYYLSDKMIDYLNNRSSNFNNGKINFKTDNDVASTITKSSSSLDISDNIIKITNVHPSGNGMNGNVFDSEGISPSITTNKGEGIKIKSATKKGYEINQNVMIGAIRGRNPENPKSRKAGLETEQMLEINENGTSNTLTTVYKDNVVVYGNLRGGKWDKTHEQSRRVYDPKGVSAALHTMSGGNQHHKIIEGYRIRKLTPLECFRLMGFPDEFLKVCSDTQLYKQCGNSIVVDVLESIISRLKI